MNYQLEVDNNLKKIFEKLKKKDPLQAEMAKKKIKHILENPYQFKPLRDDMKGSRRVHIGKSFVLTYEIHEERKVVRLLDYDHHDKIYKK